MQPYLQTSALNGQSLAPAYDLVGRKYWSYQPSTGTCTAEIDKKTYLDILDARFS